MRTLNTWAFGWSFLLRPLPLLPLEVALLTTSWSGCSTSCEQRASVRVVVLGLSSTT